SHGCPDCWGLLGDCMNKEGRRPIPAFIDLAAQRQKIGDGIEQAISSVLKSGQFVLGPEVAELERQLAEFCGATPVFVDVQRDSFNLDASSLEAAIGEAESLGLKPRCVISVDLFGQPAEYQAIRRIADANKLLVLADAAQSFGATLKGGKVGTLADYTA